jgi:hypothetical protein
VAPPLVARIQPEEQTLQWKLPQNSKLSMAIAVLDNSREIAPLGIGVSVLPMASPDVVHALLVKHNLILIVFASGRS